MFSESFGLSFGLNHHGYMRTAVGQPKVLWIRHIVTPDLSVWFGLYWRFLVLIYSTCSGTIRSIPYTVHSNSDCEEWWQWGGRCCTTQRVWTYINTWAEERWKGKCVCVCVRVCVTISGPGFVWELTLFLDLAICQVLHFFPGPAPAGCHLHWQPHVLSSERAWRTRLVCVTEYY